MYDTKTRIALVKKRMHEYHRRQERRTVCRLSVLCTLLFLSLVGATEIMQSQPINVTGMYGTILLHEDAAGRLRAAPGGGDIHAFVFLPVRYGFWYHTCLPTSFPKNSLKKSFTYIGTKKPKNSHLKIKFF